MKITLDVTSMVAGAAIAVAIGHFVPGADTASLIEAINRIPAVPVPELPSWLVAPAISFSHATTWTAFACLVALTMIAAFVAVPMRRDERSSYLERLHRRYPTSSPRDIHFDVPATATPEQFLFREVDRRRTKLASEPALTEKTFFARLAGAEGEDVAAAARSEAAACVEESLVEQIRRSGASPLLPAVRLALDICLAEPNHKKRIEAIDHLAACAWREIGNSPYTAPKLDKFLQRYRKVYPESTAFFATLHHHPCTQLMAQIEAARAATGLPTSAAFVWLRQGDRSLWHVVDNAGRTAVSAAGLGPVAHYEAEKAARRPIATPSVAGAARSLVDLCVSHRTNDVNHHSVEDMAATADRARKNGIGVVFSTEGSPQA